MKKPQSRWSINATGPLSSRQEWALLITLAAVQFTNTMDFVIIMPLGPQFMRVFGISPQQFGWIVSVYTFAASVSGLIGSFVVDQFDRKSTLLTLYLGFILGTLLCAFSQNYHLLLLGRTLAGAFGGIMGAQVFSIIGDVIVESRRGTATGTVMSAFSVSSILGVPFGLYLANRWDWHAPFFLLVATSTVIWAFVWFTLPPMRRHLESRSSESPFKTFGAIIQHPNHLHAFLLGCSLMMSAFFVVPYISPYMVATVGLKETDLPYIYLVGGSVTLFTARLIGKWSDRWGKYEVFTIMALLSLVSISLVTHLQTVPLVWAITVTTLYMFTSSGRFVPAMSMITSSVQLRYRGSFMSLNSSLQQMFIGLGAFLAGCIVQKSPAGKLTHFESVGYLSSLLTLFSVWIAKKVRIEEA